MVLLTLILEFDSWLPTIVYYYVLFITSVSDKLLFGVVWLAPPFDCEYVHSYQVIMP